MCYHNATTTLCSVYNYQVYIYIHTCMNTYVCCAVLSCVIYVLWNHWYIGNELYMYMSKYILYVHNDLHSKIDLTCDFDQLVLHL